MSAKSVFAAILALGVLDFAAEVRAAPPTVTADPVGGSMTVALSDLDLNGPAGAAAALRRIHQAADQACGGAPNMAELDRARLYRACVGESVDRAVAAVGSPTLSALNVDPAHRGLELAASR
jgi:UrcA family protein